jgi:hypothetical protein
MKKTRTGFISLKIILIALFLFCYQASFALDNSPATIKFSDTSSQNKQNNGVDSNTTITIHKPATDPVWGKVIQYQQEQAISTTDKTRETLHKFLFQDSQGIIRLATFHESTSGNGYWEVWIWDQP